MHMARIYKTYQSMPGAQHPLTPGASDPSSLLTRDHPASCQFASWLNAFNTLDQDILLSYHTDLSFPYVSANDEMGNLEYELRLAQATGGFEVVDVENSSEPSSIVLVLKERRMPGYARAVMDIDIFKPTAPVTSFTLTPIATPIHLIPEGDPRREEFEKALAPLSSTRRQAVVHGVIQTLHERYVCPELGEEIVTALENHLSNGDYDSYLDSGEFANRLVRDLHRAGHDRQMAVAFLDPGLEGTIAADSDNIYDSEDDDDYDAEDAHNPADDGSDHVVLDSLRTRNFGFGSVSYDRESVPGRTIATLPIEAFLPLSAETGPLRLVTQAVIGDILSSFADTDALIVDLRSK